MNIDIAGLFNPNNMFFRFMGRISDLMILNFLWIIFSIPIITIGASTTALYDVNLKLVDEKEGYLFKSFFTAFKENFKKGTIMWLIITLISFIIGMNLIFWIKYEAIAGYIPMSIMLFIFFIFLITEVYLFPVLAKHNKSIKDTIKFSFFISMKHLPYSIIIILINSILLGVNLVFPLTILFTIFVGFAFCALINSYLFKIVFKKSDSYLE